MGVAPKAVSAAVGITVRLKPLLRVRGCFMSPRKAQRPSSPAGAAYRHSTPRETSPAARSGAAFRQALAVPFARNPHARSTARLSGGFDIPSGKATQGKDVNDAWTKSSCFTMPAWCSPSPFPEKENPWIPPHPAGVRSRRGHTRPRLARCESNARRGLVQRLVPAESLAADLLETAVLAAGSSPRYPYILLRAPTPRVRARQS
jgi:hypothetical protein